MTLDFSFNAKIWLYQGKAAWHFITVPQDISAQIKSFAAQPKRGLGSVRVTATIGETTWKTSVFPDSKQGAYLLPVKADVRRKESLNTDDVVTIALAAEAAF
jgi:hypothetical protein